MCSRTAGHSSKYQYCPARFRAVGRYADAGGNLAHALTNRFIEWKNRMEAVHEMHTSCMFICIMLDTDFCGWFYFFSFIYLS